MLYFLLRFYYGDVNDFTLQICTFRGSGVFTCLFEFVGKFVSNSLKYIVMPYCEKVKNLLWTGLVIITKLLTS